MTVTVSPPNVFISYSWTSPEYSERVLQLAEHLVRDGVDVILDRWHLKEGQDAYSFMERAVNDAEIKRVLILCDPLYAEKANGRAGGVGTETLIISPGVYREVEQTKFLPVIMERDVNGEVVVPTYLESRLYIDLSRPEGEGAQYERLLRNLFGKPEVVRPALGPRPAFLDDERPALLTGRALEQFKDATLRDRPTQYGLLSGYLGKFAEAFLQERVTGAQNGQELLKAMTASIERFLPYRDEFADLARTLREFGEGVRLYDRLHQFFERLLEIRASHESGGFSHDAATENLAFLARELMLYVVAALIRGERFEELARLLAPFHARGRGEYSPSIYAVGILDPALPQLDQRRVRPLGDGIADLLKQRATLPDFPYQSLAEAEFLLSLRSILDPTSGESRGWQHQWFPRGAGTSWHPSDLPLCLRLRDSAYVERILPALGVRTREELIARVEAIPEREPLPLMQWLRRESIREILHLSRGADSAPEGNRS